VARIAYQPGRRDDCHRKGAGWNYHRAFHTMNAWSDTDKR